MTSNEQHYYDPDTLNSYYRPGTFIYPETVEAVNALKSKWGNNEVKAALRAHRDAGNAVAKHSRAREMYEKFGYPTQEEFDLARNLHTTTAKGKGAHMDFARYAEIGYEKEHGMRSAKSAEREILEAERKAASEINRDAFDLLRTMNEYVEVLNNNRDVMLSDEEKAEAVEKWRAERAFHEAKAEFDEQVRELRKQGNIKAVASLRAKHPYFH